MATISTKSRSQIVLSWVAAAQARANKILDFSEGSVMLALAEGASTIGLWLQRVALQVLSQTRFSTSLGADADSWGAQFQFGRLPAIPATGIVTFSRTDTSARAVVQVGQQVQTADGSEIFAVSLDTTKTTYEASVSGYVLGVGVASIDLPVTAIIADTGGNVLADTVTVILGSLSGITSVTNAGAFINGVDAEGDIAYKARFPKYLAGLARANRAAVEAAIEGVQQNIQYLLLENQNFYGSAYPIIDDGLFADQPGTFAYPTPFQQPGMFIAIVDDGSGNPSDDLLTRVGLAINAIRGLSIQYQVIRPVIATANVSFVLVPAAGYDKTALTLATVTALQNYLNSIPLGTQLLPRTKIAQVVYDAVPGVANVVDGSITINGIADDFRVNLAQIIKSGSITVN